MLKSNIDVFFCDIISLLAQVFIVSSNRVSKEVSMKQILWLSFCDMTVLSKNNLSSAVYVKGSSRVSYMKQ